jgi:hypothetical protein
MSRPDDAHLVDLPSIALRQPRRRQNLIILQLQLRKEGSLTTQILQKVNLQNHITADPGRARQGGGNWGGV